MHCQRRFRAINWKKCDALILDSALDLRIQQPTGRMFDKERIRRRRSLRQFD
jgi:hypothetical protein